MSSNLSQIFQQAYRDLRPHLQPPEFEVRFYRFANINNTIRKRSGRILVHVSDLLEGAPEPILYAILHILIAKLHRQPVDTAHAARYRRFVGSQAMTARAQVIRQMRGRKRIHGPKGRHYDLDRLFDELNLRFFHGLMARPQMTWSSGRALRRLGHYDSAHNTIVVSRIFDGPQVPRYAIEYLVYHEMLHLRHPVKLRGSKRLVHPAAFREEEKLFPKHAEAQAFLRRLGSLD